MIDLVNLELMLRRLKREKTIAYMMILDNAFKDPTLHSLDIHLKGDKTIHIGYPRYKKEYHYHVRKPEGNFDVPLFEIIIFEKTGDDQLQMDQTTKYLVDPENIIEITFKWQSFKEGLLKKIEGKRSESQYYNI